MFVWLVEWFLVAPRAHDYHGWHKGRSGYTNRAEAVSRFEACLAYIAANPTEYGLQRVSLYRHALDPDLPPAKLAAALLSDAPADAPPWSVATVRERFHDEKLSRPRPRPPRED